MNQLYRTSALLVAALICGVASGQTTGTVPAVDNDVQARAVVEEVMAAYREVPAMSTRIQVQMLANDKPIEKDNDLVVKMGRNNQFSLADRQSQIYAFDNRVVVTSNAVPDKYLEVPFEQDIMTTLEKLVSMRGNMGTMLMSLRSGRPFEDVLASFAFGMEGEPTLTGVRRIQYEGADVDQLRLSLGSASGNVIIHVDPQSRIVKYVRAEGRPRKSYGDITMVRIMRYTSVVSDTLNVPVTFEPGDRRKVDNFRDLFADLTRNKDEPAAPPNNPSEETIMAADFTLQTLDGETVSLSDLRGSIVVLDFWATWCGPCRRGLPLLNNFAKWVEDEGLNVKVYGVDVFERARSADEKIRKSKAYWDQSGFIFPSLIDLNDQIARQYGISSIPVTLIINEKGEIVTSHRGFRPGMAEQLKAEVTDLLND